MGPSHLVSAALADTSGAREWTASEFVTLLQSAGTLSQVAPYQLIEYGEDPRTKVGQALAADPAFARRVVRGQSRWRMME